MRPNQQFISLLGGRKNDYYKVDMSYNLQPNIGTTTSASASSDWWFTRVDLLSGVYKQMSLSEYSIEYSPYSTADTSSIFNNIIGCRWGITGGDGFHSYEIAGENAGIYTTYGNLPSRRHYFGWDFSATNSTYITANINGKVITNVDWYLNGSLVKNTVSHIQIDRDDIKFVYDRLTGMSYVYRSIFGTNNLYQVLIGTYSMGVSDIPTICFSSYVPPTIGGTPSATYSFTPYLGTHIVSNYIGRGLSMSNRDYPMENPPLDQRIDY